VPTEIDRLLLGADGRHAIALSARSSTGYVWDLVARRSRAFPSLNGACDRVALSADDRVGVFNCSIDEREGLTVVDLASGAARVLPMPATIVSLLGFTPSGRYLYAVARAGELLRWEVATGVLATREVHLAEGDDGDVLDEDLVYSTGADGLVLTMFSTGVSVLVDPTPDVRFFALSPDRRFAAATVAAELHGIRLWDLASGESWSVPTSRGVRRPSFTADGHVVTSGRDGMIRIYPPPPDLLAGPAETRAWLDRQTSVRVGDSLKPRPVCP
jgi:WD40 repeat protein